MEYSFKYDEYGSRVVTPKPSDDFLSEFYSQKYYQNNHGNYSKSYSDSELFYVNFHDYLIDLAIQNFSIQYPKTLADIGCGQGFTSKYFYEKGLQISATDFSKNGFEQCNQELLNNIEFVQNDIVNDDFFIDRKFDLLILKHVLEHVKSPESLITKIKKKMKPNSILAIIVPNDTENPIIDSYLSINNFSFDQIKIFGPPEHLTYFSFNSLRKFMNSQGFNEICNLGDFPIELFLLNSKTDYYKSDFGSVAHEIRCKISEIMMSLDSQKLFKLSESLGNIGLTREIISLYKID